MICYKRGIELQGPGAHSSTTTSPRAQGLARRLLYMSGASLWERFRRGEGGLLAINVTLVAFARPTALVGASQIAISALLLAAVYAINDWRDAEDDRRNPKKNQKLVGMLVEFRRPFFVWLCAMQLALIVFSWAAVGPAAAVAVAAMVAINFIYSWRLKGVPIADLFIVFAWGASYVASVTPPWSLWVAIGLMTGIMHVFQTQEDRDVDVANDVLTTVAGSARARYGAVALQCAGLYLALLGSLGPLLAASAFVPVLLQRLFVDNAKAWMASRIYCGIVVLAVLRVVYGHG